MTKYVHDHWVSQAAAEVETSPCPAEHQRLTAAAAA